MTTANQNLDKLKFMQRSQQHANRQARRAAWEALQNNVPEIAEQLSRRHGITGVACGDSAWGVVSDEDLAWVTWRGKS